MLMDLPIEFLHNIETELGEGEARKLVTALTENGSVTSIRLNTGKNVRPGTDAGPVPWCREGYYLNERPAFTFDPLFHAGLYYVQEASSMFLRQALGQYVTQPVRALDLCAAPGGKSTLALQALPEHSLLVSNEIDRQRSRILAENLIKWGNPYVFVSNNAPKDFAAFHHYFDVMITDVPCSGEGMFRKDPQAVSEWSEQNVRSCVRRQRDILSDCWDCLKPGGLLVYSTCTFNVHEDEENVHWIAEQLGAESLPVSVDEDWLITESLTAFPESVYHFFPHKTRGEGFFLAVLRKNGNACESGTPLAPDCTPLVSKKKKARISKKDRKKRTSVFSLPAEMQDWLLNPDELSCFEDGDSIIAVPRIYEEDFELLSRHLFPLHRGLTIAVRKGKQWAPAHSLAMSTAFNRQAFPHYEVDMDMAWAYLKGEVLVLPAGYPKGYVLVTYKGHPLGFVKNVGTRSNNLYPQNWKIRTGYLPDSREVLSVVR